MKIVGEAAPENFTSAQGNIKVVGDANTHTLTIQLAEALKGITSITGKAATGETPATITLTPAASGGTPSVDLNNAKLTGLAGGDIRQGSTDAVTGGQLFSALGGLDNLNAGLAGTVIYTNDTGDRVEKAKDGKYYTKDYITNTLNSYVYQNGHWYADQTKADADTAHDGTGSIDASIKDQQVSNPILSLVHEDNATKTPITLGNLMSGIGVDLAAFTNQNDEQKVSTAKTLIEDLLKIDGKDSDTAKALAEEAQLKRAATVADLQALARVGFSFLGNQNSTDGLIQLPFGSTFNIQGKSGIIYRTTDGTGENEKANASLYSADNLITHKDGDHTLRIEMLKKPGFDGVYINKDTNQEGSKGGYIGVDKDGNIVVNKVTPAAETTPANNGIDEQGNITTAKVVTENTVNNTAALTYSANGKGINNSATKQSVSLDKGLNFTGDKNIKTAVKAGGEVNISLSKDLTEINSIGGGKDADNKDKGSLTFTNRDKAGSTSGEKEKVIDAGGSVITNIGTPTKESDVANKGYVDSKVSDVDTKVDKLSDTVNTGFALNTGTQEVVDGKVVVKETGNVGQVKPNTTIVMVDGKNTKVSKVDSGSPDVISYTIEVNGIPMSYINSVGDTLVKVGDKFVALKPNGEIDPTNTNTTIAGMKVVNPDNPNKGLTVDNVADGKVAQGSKQAVNGGQLADLLGKDATVQDGKTVVENIGGTKANNLNDAIAEVKATAEKSKTKLEAGKNIDIKDKTNTDGSTTYTISLKEDLEFNKLTIGGKVSMTASTDKDGTNVLNVGGDTPSRIRGVADGVAPTDAVNKRQLDATANYLDRKINQVNRHANAGTASAMAAAGLPQANQPGYNMVSVASGYYGGENAIAIGLSKASDNGKVIFRVSGTSNSQGKVGMNAGVGYQWR